MDNYRFAIIGKVTAKAFELNVSQVLSLYFAAEDLSVDNIEEFNAILFNRIFNDDSFLQVGGKLSEQEQQTALEFWIKTNAAFFEPDKAQAGKKFSSFKSLYKSIAETVANVTRLDHQNVLNYSWSYFLIVLKNLEK